jgi:GNAT superfamily N-acetyltransferase
MSTQSDLPGIRLRRMEQRDWADVADLICISTNYWYQASGKPPIFRGGPETTMLFCEVYEDLDPGCCVLAEDAKTGRLLGSCFFHPRPTHVSLGIMNAHPNAFGRGVARALLGHVIQLAQREGKPLRLVSSAMNLDSFSLYTRAGFVPRQAYQDMFIAVPADGMEQRHEAGSGIRAARPADAPAMAELEMELAGISREKDFRYFIENTRGIWHVSVLEDQAGRLDGFLVSVAHPGSNMLGPGLCRDEEGMAGLILAELNHNRGRSPVFLIPVDRPALVRRMYAWGARNCEIHFHQALGDFAPFTGVVMPTFMPETA